MIIDADVHLSPIVSDNTLQADELIGQMEESGVNKAICWLQPPYMRDIDESLRYVYESVKKYPDKLLGFGWVDPHFGIKKSKNTIKRCLEEYGFWGVKLNGAQNAFYIDDKKMSLPLIEEIAKAGSVLALHVGADEYDYTHPYRVANLAKLYPELTILAVHMGGAGLPDLSKACIEVAVEHKNITLIGSAVGYKKVLSAIKTLGAHRVCFGSDTPFSIMHADVAAYKAFLTDYFSGEEQALVMGGNICRILKLA